MSGIHIDEFYADATHIITSLFSVFPRPVTIFAEDICGPDETDEYGLHSTRYQACFATMLWLGEEGYIRYVDTIRQDAVDQAVLSGRCFSILVSPAPAQTEQQIDPELEQLPPSVRAEHTSIIYHLQSALRSKSSTAIQTAFLPVLQRMVS